MTLEGLLSDFKVKKDKSKWMKWFWYLLAGSAALLLIGGLTYQMMSRSKIAAAALHKVDVLKEEKNLAKANAKVAASDAEFRKHIKKADAATQKIKVLKMKAVVALNEHSKAKEIIERIQSWDDVDKTIKH